MCEAKDLPSSERDELMGLVTQLQGQVAQLTAAKEELHKQVAELKRAGKRQAAPFSKGGRSSRPKRPGRKPGMGSFSYRKSPSPDEVTEPLVEVAVAEDTCPGCGGRLEHEGVRVVYATDIPPVPRPQVTGYRVQICRCRSCGKQVRGRHPDVAPDQYGASAHRVGRRVMAAAHVLHYGVGVPVRKVPAVLRALTGVELSQGAISQDALRRARGAVGDAYHKLRGSVRASPLVHTDDTGWRVDGGPAFLMAFETDEATVYQVRARHRNEEVREVVPSDYGAHYPQARIRKVDPGDDPLRMGEGEQAWSMTLRADGPEYVPLRTFRDDDLLDPGSDPLIALMGALSALEDDERVVARLLLRSLGPDWSQPHMEKAHKRPGMEPREPAYTFQTKPLQMDGVTMAVLGIGALAALKGYLWVQDGEIWKAALLGTGTTLGLLAGGWAWWRWKKAPQDRHRHICTRYPVTWGLGTGGMPVA